MNARIMMRALLVCTAMQAVLVVIARFTHLLDLRLYMFGTMMISGTAGLLYARDLARGYNAGALGGLVAGAICMALGLGMMLALRGAPAFPFGLGTVIGAVVGVCGGLFGQMGANLRALTGRGPR